MTQTNSYTHALRSRDPETAAAAAIALLDKYLILGTDNSVYEIIDHPHEACEYVARAADATTNEMVYRVARSLRNECQRNGVTLTHDQVRDWLSLWVCNTEAQLVGHEIGCVDPERSGGWAAGRAIPQR